MLILGQDKDVLVNLDMINTISIYELRTGNGIAGYRILAWCNGNIDDVVSLGDYTTEDRCKEIIREIYEIYGSYIYKPFSQAVLKGSHDLPEVYFNQPKCYEMPKE